MLAFFVINTLKEDFMIISKSIEKKPVLFGDVVLGDSISTNTGEMGWFEFMCAFSFGKLQFISNEAVGGWTIQQLNERIDTHVLPRNPKRVHIMYGTNNWNIQTAPVIMDAIDFAVKKIRNYGCDVIMYAMPPFNQNLGTFSQGNQIYSDYCIKNNIPFIDPWTFSRDGVGAWKPGMSGDGGHPIVTLHDVIGQTCWDAFPKHLLSPSVLLPQTATEGICTDVFLSGAHAPFGAGAGNAVYQNISGDSNILGNWGSLQLTSATGVVQNTFSCLYGANGQYVADGDVLVFVCRVRVRDVSSAGAQWRWQVRTSAGNGASLVYNQYMTKGSCRNAGNYFFYAKNKVVGTPNQTFNPTRLEFWVDPMGAALTGKWEIAQIGVYNLTKLGIE